jgi:hypothetical protein
MTTIKLPERCPKCKDSFEHDATISGYIYGTLWVIVCDGCDEEIAHVTLNEKES